MLTVVDCDFQECYNAIYIKNFQQYATSNPHSNFMNGFQIIDCTFRTGVDPDYLNVGYEESCIKLKDAVKATIEGCDFEFTRQGVTSSNNQAAVAILMDNRSALIHKSGNFRRNIDVYSSGGEGPLNCLRYGNNQDDLAQYPSGHPWKQHSGKKNTFKNIYQAIVADGEDNSQLSIGIDDCEFQNCVLPVNIERYKQSSISRNSFYYRMSDNYYVNYKTGSGDFFSNSDDDRIEGLSTTDRVDIAVHRCINAVVAQNSFDSDFNPGTNHHIVFSKPGIGNFNKEKYNLVYKNSFDYSHSTIVTSNGLFLSETYGSSSEGETKKILLNCNAFIDVTNAVYFGNNYVSLSKQFHHKDIQTGRNAPTMNTYGTSTCAFASTTSYSGNAFDYFYEYGGTAPNDCTQGTVVNAIEASSAETNAVDCANLTCDEFVFSSVEPKKESLRIAIYPNPSNGQITIQVPDSKNFRATICTLDGKIIAEFNVHSIKTVSLQKGIYIIRLSANKSFTYRKVIIQ